MIIDTPYPHKLANHIVTYSNKSNTSNKTVCNIIPIP